jgi:hypothetical protein
MTINNVARRLAIVVMVMLSFTPLVLLSNTVSVPILLLVAMPAAVTLLAWFAGQSEPIGSRIVLWLAGVFAAAEAITALAPADAVGPSDIILVLVYFGCALVSGLLGIVSLVVSIAYSVLGHNQEA